MSRLTRDGTAEPVSRDQILRHVHCPCSADHEQDWQPYPVDPYSAICDDHTYSNRVQHGMAQQGMIFDRVELQYHANTAGRPYRIMQIYGRASQSITKKMDINSQTSGLSISIFWDHIFSVLALLGISSPKGI